MKQVQEAAVEQELNIKQKEVLMEPTPQTMDKELVL